MRLKKNDSKREENQKIMLENEIGIDVINAYYFSEKEQKKLEIIYGKDTEEYYLEREKMKEISMVDCGMFYDIEDKDTFQGFIELKGINSVKDYYLNVTLNIEKLEELIRLRKKYRRKVYIVYTLYNVYTEDVYVEEEMSFNPKDFSPQKIKKPKCYIYDVDILEKGIKSFSRKMNKQGKLIYEIPKELSSDLLGFKNLILKDKYAKISL